MGPADGSGAPGWAPPAAGSDDDRPVSDDRLAAEAGDGSGATRDRGRGRLVVGGAIAAVVVVLIAALALRGGGGGDDDEASGGAGEGPATPAVPTVAVGQPAAVGEFPDGVAVVDDRLFVAATGAGSVAVVDVASGTVAQTLPLDDEPLAVLNAAGSVWVTRRNADVVARLDPATGEVLATVEAPGRPADLAFGAGSIWAVGPDGFVTRIDPADNTGETVQEGIPDLTAVVATDDRVWLTYGENGVALLDPATNQLTPDWATVGQDPDEAVLTDSGLWVLNRGEGTVTQLDPATGAQRATLDVGTEPTGITVDAQDPDRLWVIDKTDGTLTLVAASTGQVLVQQPVGTEPLGVATSPGRVWVTLSGDDAVVAVDITG